MSPQKTVPVLCTYPLSVPMMLVARAAGIPSLFMINKRGKPVRWWILQVNSTCDELDERFIADNARIDL